MKQKNATVPLLKGFMNESWSKPEHRLGNICKHLTVGESLLHPQVHHSFSACLESLQLLMVNSQLKMHWSWILNSKSSCKNAEQRTSKWQKKEKLHASDPRRFDSPAILGVRPVPRAPVAARAVTATTDEQREEMRGFALTAAQDAQPPAARAGQRARAARNFSLHRGWRTAPRRPAVWRGCRDADVSAPRRLHRLPVSWWWWWGEIII